MQTMNVQRQAYQQSMQQNPQKNVATLLQLFVPGNVQVVHVIFVQHGQQKHLAYNYYFGVQTLQRHRRYLCPRFPLLALQQHWPPEKSLWVLVQTTLRFQKQPVPAVLQMYLRSRRQPVPRPLSSNVQAAHAQLMVQREKTEARRGAWDAAHATKEKADEAVRLAELAAQFHAKVGEQLERAQVCLSYNLPVSPRGEECISPR